jgi:putative transposase
VAELVRGLHEHFRHYSAERPHQALDYRTPERVHCSGAGGGAVIADRFGSAAAEPAQRLALQSM